MRITLSEEQVNYIIDNIENEDLKNHLIDEVNKHNSIDNSKRAENLKNKRYHISQPKIHKFFLALNKLYIPHKKISMYSIQKKTKLSINTVRSYCKICEKGYNIYEEYKEEYKNLVDILHPFWFQDIQRGYNPEKREEYLEMNKRYEEINHLFNFYSEPRIYVKDAYLAHLKIIGSIEDEVKTKLKSRQN